ncbi:VWA domain-containing protein [Planctomycetota bacterium]
MNHINSDQNCIPSKLPGQSLDNEYFVRHFEAVFSWTFWLIFSLSAHALVISAIIAAVISLNNDSGSSMVLQVTPDHLITIGDESNLEREVEFLAPEDPVQEPKAQSPEVVNTNEPDEDIGVPEEEAQDKIDAPPEQAAGTGNTPVTPTPGDGNIGSGLIASNEFSSVIGDLRGRGLEIVFLFDSTGSMGQYLNETKKKIIFLTKLIDAMVPKNRIAIGTYRDRGDDYVVRGLPLTTNKKKLHRYMKDILAEGGGDEPEALAEALLWAFNENKWSPEAEKVVIFIGDAQPHRGSVLDTALAQASRFAADQRGHVNAIVTYTYDQILRGERPARTNREFEKITAAGQGTVLAFQEEGTLAKRLLLLAFGAKWEEDINSLYTQALQQMTLAGDKIEFHETPRQRRKRLRSILLATGADPNELQRAIKEISSVMEAEDVETIFTLADHNDVFVSYQAIKTLLAYRLIDKDLLAETTGQQLIDRPTSSFRGFYLRALGQLENRNGIPALIHVLENPQEEFEVFRAREMLEAITGINFGKKTKRWIKWWEVEKQR